jgi:Transposase zinc-binding domain
MASSLGRLALCPSQSLNLVCKILISLLGLSETNTIGYYDDLVAKMLNGGNLEKMGYIEYRCLQCGQGKHLVAMSCKSSLCLRCAKVYVDNSNG